MVTLYTIPKPFRNHIQVIQYNALKSWTQMGGGVKIVLFGNEEGSAGMAAQLGIEHIPDVALNEFGTPLVSDVFRKVREVAETELLCYVNADIILLEDFVAALKRCQAKRQSFLMVGQRWDIEQEEVLEFRDGWKEQMREKVRRQGVLHEETGIDYFAYTTDLFKSLPDFAIGRSAWDNWLLYHARSQGAALIDASRAVVAIHQNHDYAHVPQGEYGAWKGPEAVRNLALAGGYAHCFTISDSTWVLTQTSFRPAFARKYLRRRPIAWIILHDRLYRLLKFIRNMFKPGTTKPGS